MKIRIIIFFLFTFEIVALEHQKILLSFDKKVDFNCEFGYFYIDSNEQGSGGGHAGLLLQDNVYHYQRVMDRYFILDKTEIHRFIYNYSRILNRNLHLLCIDITNLKQNVSILKDKLELKHTKDNFYAFTHSYYQNLLNQLKEHFLIPVIPYFSFSEEDFLIYVQQNPVEEDTLKQIYHYNIILYLLEIFYKYYLKSSLTMNQNYFIKISYQKEPPYNEVIKNLNVYLEEWEKHDNWIETEITEDRYLTLLESKVYKEALNYFIKNHEFFVPFLIIQYERGTINTYLIENKILDLNQEFQDPIYVSLKNILIHHIEEFYQSILKKESLQTIQYHLKKISYLANQILLLQNKENFFRLNIGILNTPQLYYTNSKLLEIMKEKFRNSNNMNDAIKQKLVLLKTQHPEIFDYHLIFKNCITELFLFLYKEVEDEVLKEIVYNVYHKNKIIPHTLKGHFIPWKSYDVLKQELNKNRIQYKEYYIPSFRNEYLQVMKNNHQTTIKEMTTFTSDVYQYNTNDSFFIFFTEQNVYLRPVYGLFNISFSLMKISLDLLTLPYDIYKDQVYISKELRGLFFSFTELGWVNVRKGTYLHNNFPEEYKIIFFQPPSIGIKP